MSWRSSSCSAPSLRPVDAAAGDVAGEAIAIVATVVVAPWWRPKGADRRPSMGSSGQRTDAGAVRRVAPVAAVAAAAGQIVADSSNDCQRRWDLEWSCGGFGLSCS